MIKKQNHNSEESSNSLDGDNTQPPKLESSTPMAANFLQAVIASSFLWYPFACFLIAAPFTLITSYFVSDEGLQCVISAYLVACYLIPALAFVVLMLTNRWFRKSFLWILLLWFGTSQIGPITPSAMTRAFNSANKAIRAQLKTQTTNHEK
ncbi:MAG: hypothetical protein C0508_08570 [Cyanobacteria bacterium PR.023]|nr:hypothetical protein [Cyanobacteria bacterium PR.023]